MGIGYKKFYNHKELIFLILYSTILFGYFFNEDTLGGARNDFLHHYKISEKFNKRNMKTFFVTPAKSPKMSKKERTFFLFEFCFFLLQSLVKK